MARRYGPGTSLIRCCSSSRVVACLARLVITVEGLSGGPSRRVILGVSGLLAALCGAWLVVGPLAWRVLEGGAFLAVGAPPLRELAYWIGYSLGPGGLLLAFGAFVIGRPRAGWQAAPAHSPGP